MRIDATSYAEAAGRIVAWAHGSESRYVCAASVNNVIESCDSAAYRRVMNQADLVTADGMPLVWALRMMGVRGAARIYGPDLMLHLLDAAQREGLPVGFYGTTEATLAKLTERLGRRCPTLRIGYRHAPPFREITPEEDARLTEEIRGAGVRILFVGLGAPKQELWMAAHRGRIPAVMVGVGAAFDFLAGTKPQAPRWMQDRGLEWLFRMASEPRRLGPRYLRGNPRFVVLFARQLLAARFRAT